MRVRVRWVHGCDMHFALASLTGLVLKVSPRVPQRGGSGKPVPEVSRTVR